MKIGLQSYKKYALNDELLKILCAIFVFFMFFLENKKNICILWRFLKTKIFVYGKIAHYRGLVDGTE